ncbi:hypothetical protein ACQPZZ_16625 [Microbispora sp. CA-135349]|uniref:hypothetical protein n=1 Tax=Microbispora sp. CA-135349 TaxID=3239953 RepID=UPI003D91A3E0
MPLRTPGGRDCSRTVSPACGRAANSTRREFRRLAVAVIAALRGGYLLAEIVQDERPFLVAFDMALDQEKAQVRAPVTDLTQSDN